MKKKGSVGGAPAVVVLGPRLVDGQRPAAEIGAVQGQRLLGLVPIAELDESEPLGTAGFAVGDDLGGVRRAELCEHLVQLIVGDVVREVAYVELHQIHPSCRAKSGRRHRRRGTSHSRDYFRSGFVRTDLAKASESRTKTLYHISFFAARAVA